MAVIWSVMIAWAFSAVLHSTDSEIGSIGGVFTLRIFISVTIVSLYLLVLPMFLCLLSFHRYRWKGFVTVLFLTAVVLGLFLHLSLGGSTATTIGEFTVSVVGMMVISVLVIGLALLPHIVMLSRKPGSVALGVSSRGTGEVDE